MFHRGSFASTGELCGEASKQVLLVQLLLLSLCHLEKDLGTGNPQHSSHSALWGRDGVLPRTSQLCTA